MDRDEMIITCAGCDRVVARLDKGDRIKKGGSNYYVILRETS